jgi:hypothetical protein
MKPKTLSILLLLSVGHSVHAASGVRALTNLRRPALMALKTPHAYPLLKCEIHTPANNTETTQGEQKIQPEDLQEKKIQWREESMQLQQEQLKLLQDLKSDLEDGRMMKAIGCLLLFFGWATVTAART